MNKLLTFTLALGLACSTLAQGYTTKASNGNAAAPANVIFPAKDGQQIRLVGVNWASDTNNAALSLSSGVGAYTLLATNTTTGVTQVVASVTGLAASDVLVLQHAGVCYATTIASTNSGTNIVLASGAWGVTPAIGDSVYRMSTPTTLPIGATTNWQAGEAIFVSTYAGRPVRAVLTPANVTNQLNSVTAKYE